VAVEGIEVTTKTCPGCGIRHSIRDHHDCSTRIKPSVLIAIVAVLLFIGLIGGASCNLKIQIKQTPTKVETKD
jgi:hypothetical protein